MYNLLKPESRHWRSHRALWGYFSRDLKYWSMTLSFSNLTQTMRTSMPNQWYLVQKLLSRYKHTDIHPTDTSTCTTKVVDISTEFKDSVSWSPQIGLRAKGEKNVAAHAWELNRAKIRLVAPSNCCQKIIWQKSCALQTKMYFSINLIIIIHVTIITNIFV